MLGKASEIKVVEMKLDQIKKWISENPKAVILDIKYAIDPVCFSKTLIIYKEDENLKNKNVEITKFGFQWEDMEIIRSSDDEDGLLILKLRRSNRTHEISINKDGDVSVKELI